MSCFIQGYLRQVIQFDQLLFPFLLQISREEEMIVTLKEAGFSHIGVYADREFCDPRPNEQRIYLKARKGIRK